MINEHDWTDVGTTDEGATGETFSFILDTQRDVGERSTWTDILAWYRNLYQASASSSGSMNSEVHSRWRWSWNPPATVAGAADAHRPSDVRRSIPARHTPAASTCPCGAVLPPGRSRWCSSDCEPSPTTVDDTSQYDGTQARWRPELESLLDEEDLTLLVAWPLEDGHTLRVLRRGAVTAQLGEVRLDDGHRFVGTRVTLPGGASGTELRALADARHPSLHEELHRKEALNPSLAHRSAARDLIEHFEREHRRSLPRWHLESRATDVMLPRTAEYLRRHMDICTDRACALCRYMLPRGFGHLAPPIDPRAAFRPTSWS